jgi:hypothetical protein
LRCVWLQPDDVDTGRPGKYQDREHKHHDVQRSGRSKLRQRTKSPARQPRRARREVVKDEHTNESGKTDTGRSWSRS